MAASLPRATVPKSEPFAVMDWLRRLLGQKPPGDALRARNDKLLSILREHAQRLAILTSQHPPRAPEGNDETKPAASDRRSSTSSRRPI